MATELPSLLSAERNGPDAVKQQDPVRVAIVVEGTRGDCQPYCVLASALVQQGHEVRFLTNCDLTDFVRTFGVDARPCGYNAEQFWQENEDIQLAMKTGDFFKFANALNSNEALDLYRDHIGNYWRELDAFGPEVVLCGPLTQSLCVMYQFRRCVPFMTCGLQPLLATVQCAPLGLPSLPAWTGLNRSIWRLIFQSSHKVALAKHAITEEVVGEDLGWALDYTWFMDFNMDRENTAFAPAVYGTSFNFSQRASDWPKSCTMTGWWTMDEAEQQRQCMNGSAYFGGGKHQELIDFVDAGEAPVYLGWGSMIAKSREHMAGLAVRALMRTQKRGVVLGGWADLTLECLQQESDWPDLKSYCDKNVLFVKSAPHAWLFPQCTCIVHHGGSGTTAASVKAGVPTIITPIFLDQWDYAALVNEHNIGVGTGALVKVTVDILAKAIKTCSEDGTVQRNAQQMAELVRQEDGIGTATKVITEFVKGKVRTGAFHKELEVQKAKYNPRKVPAPSKIWSWCTGMK